MKRVHMESVTSFARQFCQTRVHTCNVNWNIWMFDCSRVEEGRHQRDLVILPAEVQLRPILPAIPKRTDDLDLLTQFARHRLWPLLTKSSLNVRLDLRAESQDKSSAGL